MGFSVGFWIWVVCLGNCFRAGWLGFVILEFVLLVCCGARSAVGLLVVMCLVLFGFCV